MQGIVTGLSAYHGFGNEVLGEGVQQRGWGAVANPLNWIPFNTPRNAVRTLSGGWAAKRYRDHFNRITPLLPEFNRSHLSPGTDRFPADAPYSTFDYVNRKR